MIPKQPFGRTGHASTRIIFGGYALSDATHAEASRVLELLLEHGVNHIDTAAMYGKSEELVGSWMDQHRDDFFLATKSRSRSYKGAMNDLQRSLSRLRVDYVDLWQMHGLTNPVSWEKVMAPGGALEAFVEAREKGLVRYLGITGHGNKVPAMHKQSLERFDFDAVLLPYNFLQMQNPRYSADLTELVEICHKRKVAVQTIKSVVRRPWGPRAKTHNTYFYEPLVNHNAINKSVHWSMGLSESFVITAGDIQILPRILDAAMHFRNRPNDEEMTTLVDELDMQVIRCSSSDFK
ncbi:MAG: aldo/keto reductase [Candidatus Thorarchaeota archaeon]